VSAMRLARCALRDALGTLSVAGMLLVSASVAPEQHLTIGYAP